MTYNEFVKDVGHGCMSVWCPDGIERAVWGYNKTTGDVSVAGWNGDVFINASNPNKVGVDFE